jgi:hypothetical protein
LRFKHSAALRHLTLVPQPMITEIIGTGIRIYMFLHAFNDPLSE